MHRNCRRIQRIWPVPSGPIVAAMPRLGDASGDVLYCKYVGWVVQRRQHRPHDVGPGPGRVRLVVPGIAIIVGGLHLERRAEVSEYPDAGCHVWIGLDTAPRTGSWLIQQIDNTQVIGHTHYNRIASGI